MEGWSKKEKGLLDMDNSVVIAGEREYKGLKNNGLKIQSRLNKKSISLLPPKKNN